VRLFDETAQCYQDLLKPTTSTHNLELTVKEGQLTWLVYIIGAVIGGRASYNVGNTEEYDMFDGELVVRVLQLMTFMNTHLEQSNGRVCCEKIDLAMLNFFEQFRKIFIGEQMQKCSKVYKRMSEMLSIHDETIWLDVVTRKM
jgi:exportin-7